MWVTRDVKLTHVGLQQFPNYEVWGKKTDAEPPMPPDILKAATAASKIQGWMSWAELAHLEKGEYWPPRGKGKTHYIPNPCDHEMFQHLRFKGATIETRSTVGVVAEELMDLNDPEAIAYRTFILDAITTCEGTRVELKKAFLQIRAKQTEGAVTADATAQAIAKLDAHLVQGTATLIVSSDGNSPLPIGLPAADAAPPWRRGV